MIALVLLQAATPVAAPPAPERFSILAPQCTPDPNSDDIVVCDRNRLPLPEDRGPPDHPVPGNPYKTGAGALAMETPPCATLQGGCDVGFNIFGPGVALVRVITKVVNPANDCCTEAEATDPLLLVIDGVRSLKNAGRKKPDKTGRVAISLDADDPPIPPLKP